MAIVVQKYGGSSLVDAFAIQRVARRIVKDRDMGDMIVAVVSAMASTTDNLIDLARQFTDKPDPRELDVLLSTGELVSCTLMAMALRALGCEAVSLSGAQAGIRTNMSYGKARITVVEPARVLDELNCGRIVIVAGFQGITDYMDVTTLGRGASDLTAVALAAGLDAEVCKVYTDVEGIYTADPKLVPKARKLQWVGFEEMLEMASHGAKMEPRSIEMAMEFNVPIMVASSFFDKPGTLIQKEAHQMNSDVGEMRNRVRSVATDSNVSKITVRGVMDRPGIAAAVFEPLAQANISVDIIVQNISVGGVTDITFTVNSSDLTEALEVTKESVNPMGPLEVISKKNLAKISIVGTGMQDSAGYAAAMFSALSSAGVNIEMITTSEIRITCVVEEAHLENAAQSAHEAFELSEA